MNAHHLKHNLQPPPGRSGYKMVLHDIIVNRLGLCPFQPLADHSHVAMAKSGRFHQSTCAIALYSNAFTQKAAFPSGLAPFGYLHRKHCELFSFGVYRRNDGELFGSVIPLTTNLAAISDFCHEAVAELPVRGIYVRFLRAPDYARLVSDYGFTPAKEEPWLRDAPEEDESLSHSRVDLNRLFLSSDAPILIYPPLKRNLGRATNYMKRAGLKFSFIPLTPENSEIGWDLVKRHFEMLNEKGKLVGSTQHDYMGLLQPDILSLRTVTAYLGLLNELPVSVFIGESNGNHSISGYAGITLRGIDYRTGRALPVREYPETGSTSGPKGDGELTRGISAIPTYVFIRLFSKLYAQGFRFFFMGGSEHADIDAWKHKQMGAEKDPTYWAVFKRQ